MMEDSYKSHFTFINKALQLMYILCSEHHKFYHIKYFTHAHSYIVKLGVCEIEASHNLRCKYFKQWLNTYNVMYFLVHIYEEYLSSKVETFASCKIIHKIRLSACSSLAESCKFDESKCGFATLVGFPFEAAALLFQEEYFNLQH